MNSTDLRKRLHTGKMLFGTLIVSPSPRWPDVVRGCGLDFVFIDTEHILEKFTAENDATKSSGKYVKKKSGQWKYPQYFFK